MYRKKPVVVEAWQFTPPALTDVPDWLSAEVNAGKALMHHGPPTVITIETLEGFMTAQPGDWIIKGVKGEIYPCKPDIFAATYEPAETERLPDVEAALQPCGYCEKHVAIPCRNEQMAQRCDELRPDTSDIPETGAEWFEKASYIASKVDVEPNPPEDSYHHPNQRATRFRDEMQQVINSHSRENGSDTPDFILAEFMLEVFDAFDKAVTKRTGWYKPPGPVYDRITELEVQLHAEGEHTAAGQAEIERLNAENAQLRGELQRVSMAGMTPSMVVGK